MTSPPGKHIWTAKVGEKGQIVIPKEARDIFGIRPGDTLILLGDERRGLALVKSEALVDFAHAVLDTQKEGEKL